MKKGTIVEFTIGKIRFIGKIEELDILTADCNEIARIKCFIDNKEEQLFIPVDNLTEARFPEYYKETTNEHIVN